MTPIFFFAVSAALAGLCLQKRWWGALYFFSAMTTWFLVMTVMAILQVMHSLVGN